ncbi:MULTISPECIES: glycosyltransferase 87 family protein [unclassified Rathayibacter]|uniref:glycosyltransferase 87 family protein n=1 Tax=unclassified Rathayibacter TaxID=2609250 RepID=UPI00188D9F88|nr:MULTISPECIES: glycosyltransferase 87 family protein [unclassified Rathayibacter]MBF4461948.1 DUF2029 domain-containing protein [Rathayibacter sp. VKM Ac-2879]MBF4504009.1 DUF2029 domain-containing protein [Rathayibacter sp. VKM Ac-2878]
MTPTITRGRVVLSTGFSGLLTDRGITVDELSDQAGIPVEELNRFASGHAAGIRFDSLLTISDVLGCDIDELLPLATKPGDSPQVKPQRTVTRPPAHWRFALGGSAVSLFVVWVLTAIISAVNPVDFLVYRYGSAGALAGNDIYNGNLAGPMMPAEGLPFTYTPFAALTLLPTNVFAPITAFVVWSLLTMALLAWVIWRCTPPGPSRVRHALIAFALSGFSIVVASHIIFGQINILLMTLCLADIARSPHSRLGRLIPPGVLVGVAAAIKLTPALFIVYFAVTRQWRRTWWSIAAAGTCTLAAATIYPAASRTFFAETVWHLSDKVDLGGLFATSGNNSIQGALAYFNVHPLLAALLALGAGALGILAAHATYTRGHALDAAVIVGITACLVSPVSWLHHWVYLVPALVILSVNRSRSSRRFVCVASLVILATGPTVGDVLLGTGLAWVWPFAIILRESLLLIGIMAAVLLWRRATGAPYSGVSMIDRS